MSDTIDAAAPTLTESAGQRVLTGPADAAADHLRPRDLTRLAQGFYFIFWGSLAVLSTMAEALGAPTLRLYSIMIGGAGALGMLAGSWRLYQTKDLGRDWKSLHSWAAHRGDVGRVSVSVFLHVAACADQFVPALSRAGVDRRVDLSHEPVERGRRRARKAGGAIILAVQALFYGGVAFIVLFAPFVLLAQSLVVATWHGGDPLAALQFLLARIHTVYVLMVLIPFSLTLSLAWTAKDIVLRRLTARDSEKAVGPESA